VRYVLVLEAGSPAPQYLPLLDRLERLGAERVLRTAWIVDASSPSDVYDMLKMWMPCDDRVLVLPYAEQRFARNLRAPGPLRKSLL
jgi:hypothetical protein